jgi:multidrug efflux pump subunit AcrA (membrane-fusion protein)
VVAVAERATGQSETGGPQAVAVETATAEERDVTPALEAVGSLRPMKTYRPAEISGRSRPSATEGQRVAKGATLVELDDSLYRAEVDKARQRSGTAHYD